MHGIDEKELYAVKVSETIIDVLATYWSYNTKPWITREKSTKLCTYHKIQEGEQWWYWQSWKERRKLETVNISNTGKNIQLCSVGQEVQMVTSIELVQ